MRPDSATNLRELVALIATHAIRIAVQFMLATAVLSGVYRELVAHGHAIWITPLSLAVSAVASLLSLPLFLALRAGFGGVPALAGGFGREYSFATTGPEIGAYLLAVAIGLVEAAIVNGFAFGRLYVALQASGHRELIQPVALAAAAGHALIFVAIFVGLRRGFSAGRVAALRAMRQSGQQDLAARSRPANPGLFYSDLSPGTGQPPGEGRVDRWR